MQWHDQEIPLARMRSSRTTHTKIEESAGGDSSCDFGRCRGTNTQFMRPMAFAIVFSFVRSFRFRLCCVSFFTSTVCDRRFIFSASIHLRCHMPSKICYCSIVVALINLFASNVQTAYEAHRKLIMIIIIIMPTTETLERPHNLFPLCLGSRVGSLPFFSHFVPLVMNSGPFLGVCSLFV